MNNQIGLFCKDQFDMVSNIISLYLVTLKALE